MYQIKKIALTGGPCSGKSEGIEYLKSELKSRGVKVEVVPETATALMKSGNTPENMGSFDFHRLLFTTQLRLESQALERLEMENGERVLLCDRGLLDSRAYVSESDYARYSAEHGLNEQRVRDRYDAVFHLVTAAYGAEKFYNLKNNVVRGETPEQAIALDKQLLSLWTGTSHLRIVDNSTGFERKLQRLLRETLAFLGIPRPLEIERKFLIERPSDNALSQLPACRRVPVMQAYLKTPEEGKFRIRRRGEGKDAVYIKTVKEKISDIKRVEREEYISEKEFNTYLSQKEFISGIISKDRYCIAENSSYYELDVFPFWQNLALLEIELLSENQPFKLPSFVKVIKEVTFEREFTNKQLSVNYAKFFQ